MQEREKTSILHSDVRGQLKRNKWTSHKNSLMRVKGRIKRPPECLYTNLLRYKKNQVKLESSRTFNKWD